jgi:hypothetical protein
MPYSTSGLSSNALKWTALSAMVLDHFAWAFLPETSAVSWGCHFFGAFSMPLFVFLLAEGFRHTSDLKAYGLRLFLFSLISWFPFALFSSLIRQEPFSFFSFFRLSMMHSLFLSLVTLWLWEKTSSPFWRFFGILLLCLASLPGDGLFIPLLLALVFHTFHDIPVRRYLASVTVCILFFFLLAVAEISPPSSSSFCEFLTRNSYRLGMIFGLVLTFFYHGAHKKTGKWFFYIFYPAHLLLLSLIMIFR